MPGMLDTLFVGLDTVITQAAVMSCRLADVIIEPRARPLLVLIPFVMVARVAVLAHFVSDVFGGLALTALVAWAFAPMLAAPAGVVPARG